MVALFTVKIWKNLEAKFTTDQRFEISSLFSSLWYMKSSSVLVHCFSVEIKIQSNNSALEWPWRKVNFDVNETKIFLSLIDDKVKQNTLNNKRLFSVHKYMNNAG